MSLEEWIVENARDLESDLAIHLENGRMPESAFDETIRHIMTSVRQWHEDKMAEMRRHCNCHSCADALGEKVGDES